MTNDELDNKFNEFISKLDKLIEDYNSGKLFSDFYNNKLKEFGFSDEEISKIPDSEKLEKLKEEALKDTTGKSWINLHTEYSKILDNPEMLEFITMSLKKIQDEQFKNIQNIENEASEIGKTLEEKKKLYQGLIDERNKILEENNNVVEEIDKIDTIINGKYGKSGYNKKIKNIETEMKSVDENSSQYKRLELDLKFYQNRINILKKKKEELSKCEGEKFKKLNEEAKTLGYKKEKEDYDALQGKISNLKEQYRENSKKIEERYRALGKDPNEIIKNADFGKSRESKVQEFNSQEINSNITSPTPENPKNKENIEENNISNQVIDENQANTPTYNNNQEAAYVNENQANSNNVIDSIEEPTNIDRTQLVTTDYATRDSIKLAGDYAKIESAEERSKLLSNSLIFEDLVKTLRDTSKKSRISGLKEKLMKQAESIDIPDDSESNIDIIKQAKGGGLLTFDETKVLEKMFDKKLGKEYLTGMREYSKDDLKVLTNIMEAVTNNDSLSPELKGKFNETFLQYVQLNSLNIQNGKISATKFLEKRLPFGRAKAQRDFEEAIFQYTAMNKNERDFEDAIYKDKNNTKDHEDSFIDSLQKQTKGRDKSNEEEVVYNTGKDIFEPYKNSGEKFDDPINRIGVFNAIRKEGSNNPKKSKTNQEEFPTK